MLGRLGTSTCKLQLNLERSSSFINFQLNFCWCSSLLSLKQSVSAQFAVSDTYPCWDNTGIGSRWGEALLRRCRGNPLAARCIPRNSFSISFPIIPLIPNHEPSPGLPSVYLHTNSPELVYFLFTSSYFGNFVGAGQPGRSVLVGSRSVWDGRVPLLGRARRWAMGYVDQRGLLGLICLHCRVLQKYGTRMVLTFHERLLVTASLSHFRWDESCTLQSVMESP